VEPSSGRYLRYGMIDPSSLPQNRRRVDGWSRGRQVIQSLMQIMCLPAPVGDREGTIQTKSNNPKISPAKSGEFWTRLCLSRSFFLSHQPITEQPQTRETKILPEQMRRLGFSTDSTHQELPSQKTRNAPKEPFPPCRKNERRERKVPFFRPGFPASRFSGCYFF
jgi:hypothetical protein